MTDTIKNYIAYKPLTANQKHLWTTPICDPLIVADERGYMVNGGNATSGEIGSDTLLNKYNPSLFTGYPPLDLSGNLSKIPTACINVGIGDASIPILADVSVLDGSISSGYFLLEINGKMSNDFTGNTFDSNLIMGVLSRYYSLGNYTSSDTSSLTYIHKGEPIILTEIGVRILQPNGRLAKVGNDNSIFIKVIKPPPVAPPPTKAGAKKSV